jgi:hypothetical protein
MHYILACGQNTIHYQHYLAVVKQLSDAMGQPFIVTACTFRTLPPPDERPIDFIIATVRESRHVYRLVPRLFRLVDARRVLLLLEPPVRPAALEECCCLGCHVAELPTNVDSLRAIFATLLVSPYAASISEQNEQDACICLDRRKEVGA